MTEILDLKVTLAYQPVIIKAIRFDPWPFDDETVGLDSAHFIDDTGEVQDAVEQQGWENACLTPDYDVLVVLSDGSVLAASEQGVRAYGRPSPP